MWTFQEAGIYSLFLPTCIPMKLNKIAHLARIINFSRKLLFKFSFGLSSHYLYFSNFLLQLVQIREFLVQFWSRVFIYLIVLQYTFLEIWQTNLLSDFCTYTVKKDRQLHWQVNYRKTKKVWKSTHLNIVLQFADHRQTRLVKRSIALTKKDLKNTTKL